MSKKKRKFRAMTVGEWCDPSKCSQCEYHYNLHFCSYAEFNRVNKALTKPLNKKELIEHLKLHIKHKKKLEKMFRGYIFNGWGCSLDKNAFTLPNKDSDEKSLEFRNM